MKLSLLPEKMAVLKLEPTELIPKWALINKSFVSITYTTEELSVVCPQNVIPPCVKVNGDWNCIKVEGPLDFSMTGVLSSLAEPLANAGISIFVVSTYDTDYLLVKSDRLQQSLETLAKHGHTIIS